LRYRSEIRFEDEQPGNIERIYSVRLAAELEVERLADVVSTAALERPAGQFIGQREAPAIQLRDQQVPGGLFDSGLEIPVEDGRHGAFRVPLPVGRGVVVADRRARNAVCRPQV